VIGVRTGRFAGCPPERRADNRRTHRTRWRKGVIRVNLRE